MRSLSLVVLSAGVLGAAVLAHLAGGADGPEAPLLDVVLPAAIAAPVQVRASLDHAVWFHRPARGDQWLLFDMRLQSLQGSRGVAHGTVHSADGHLVATVAQEGLLRRIAL